MGTRAIRSSRTALAATLPLALLAALALAGCRNKQAPAASAGATPAAGAEAAPTGFQAVTALVMDPGDPRDPSVLYAATPLGLFKSTDGARSWHPLTSLADHGVYAVYLDPTSPPTVYAIYSTGDADPGLALQRSDDGGATWADVSKAGPPRIHGWSLGLWFDATSKPSTVYMWGWRDDGLHVFRSTDRGENWTALRGAAQKKAAALRDAGRPSSAATWIATGPALEVTGGRPLVDPHYSWVQYAGTKDGVYKSLDGGRTWRRASAGL
jgi:hypothetical protein